MIDYQATTKLFDSLWTAIDKPIPNDRAWKKDCHDEIENTLLYLNEKSPDIGTINKFSTWKRKEDGSPMGEYYKLGKKEVGSLSTIVLILWTLEKGEETVKSIIKGKDFKSWPWNAFKNSLTTHDNQQDSTTKNTDVQANKQTTEQEAEKPTNKPILKKWGEEFYIFLTIISIILIGFIIIFMNIPFEKTKVVETPPNKIHNKDSNNIKPSSSSIFVPKPEIEGKSENNKMATFTVVYLTDGYRWAYSKETLLQTNEHIKDVLIPNLPHYPKFDTALGFIAVGMASQEQQNREEEESRAEARADQITEILRTEIGNRELYKLYLGKFKYPEAYLSKEETGRQRRVMIISIIKKDKNMSKKEIEEALKDAFNDKEKLDFDYENYTQFKLKDAIGSSTVL